MPPQKRKRSSSEPKEDNGASEAPRSTKGLPDDRIEPLFRVEIFKDAKAIQKSKRKRSSKNGEWTSPKSEVLLSEKDQRVEYVIVPASNWESMKKYRNFVVNDNTFSVHDFVYVNHEDTEKNKESDDEGDEAEDEGDLKSWVAYVLEVRAKNPNHVYLRVYWMYHSRDLPGGRQHYHGQDELIASNHMDIIDAQTVMDKLQVTHMKEEDEEETTEGYYWRQRFDVCTGKLSPLRRTCTCNQYHNPDKLLLQCSNAECRLWLHEDCIMKHALEKAVARVSLKENNDKAIPNPRVQSGFDDEASGTIEVPPRNGKQNGFQPSSSEKPTEKSSGGKRGRVSKSKMKSKEKSYEGRFTGRLEFRSKEHRGGTIEEATGKIFITDLHDDEQTTSEVDMVCPKCEEPLHLQNV